MSCIGQSGKKFIYACTLHAPPNDACTCDYQRYRQNNNSQICIFMAVIKFKFPIFKSVDKEQCSKLVRKLDYLICKQEGLHKGIRVWLENLENHTMCWKKFLQGLWFSLLRAIFEIELFSDFAIVWPVINRLYWKWPSNNGGFAAFRDVQHGFAVDTSIDSNPSDLSSAEALPPMGTSKRGPKWTIWLHSSRCR